MRPIIEMEKFSHMIRSGIPAVLAGVLLLVFPAWDGASSPVAAAQTVTMEQDPAGQMDRQRMLNRLYSTGYKYYQIQDYAGAIPAFKRYTELDSTNMQAWYFLGPCYTMTEQWEKVVETYKRILRLQPDDINALQNLAFAYNERGETALVVEVYERIVELAPNDIEYRDYLLGLYQRDQNSEGMIRLLEQQAERSPDDPGVHRQLAELHRRRGDVEAQIASLEEAVKGEPGNTQNLLRLGSLYLTDMNQPCEAARVFDLLAQAAPDDPVAWRLLGRARDKCGMAEGAITAFQKALGLKPDEIHVYSELGHALALVGGFDSGQDGQQEAAGQATQKDWR